ncbi:hypothetical protein RN001_008922 [Aquatica leii]|uniref:Nondiscriminating glutamyl-tRNA synthetase EARS2, mitochondrial n=1 Tax=Aquatica leii TaxID=1421715 RepID=A0AAN7PHW3_9COLE|nr:hypothetical protein RN001_008922 [Aquatica leii]
MFKRINPTFINTVCWAHRHTNDVRVRFAPSPTGFLHLGGLRTALYNFLFAKSNGGKFILRIEDTDQSRVVHGAAEQLQKDLNWAGIYIDEGPRLGGQYGPYIQSQRLKSYKEHVEELLTKNVAYRCFCTNRRLDLLRVEALRTRQIPKYDNRCQYLTEEDVNKKLKENVPFCIRFKLTPGVQTFDDLIYGSISYDVGLNEGDPVIFKSDGFPTYHFANVVDDHLMKISHVLRGVEWQISTTKHIMLYRSFNWEAPVYGHLPLLINPDGTKLSKRQGDIQISHYRESGILPQALINFITHSGGGFDKDQERFLKPKIYTMDELANQFDVKNINTHSGKLMPERLPEFNRLELERHLKTEEESMVLVSKMENIIKNKFSFSVSDNSLNLDREYIKSTLIWASNRINRLDDLVSNKLAFLWVSPIYSEKIDANELTVIQKFRSRLEEQQNFTKDDLKLFLKEFSEENNFQFSNLTQLLRSILSGLKEGPSVAEMIEILGKENTLLRLQTYINKYDT